MTARPDGAQDTYAGVDGARMGCVDDLQQPFQTPRWFVITIAAATVLSFVLAGVVLR
ncbi:hypothetical protein [Blastococcus sp. TF02A-26]|uniref:hypothetical protein n=1 Tax=Blastococcus sp. TF02A-26 TaxID=2250577 RepID=UPI001314FA30|nr:hypothetical protein [Blastococcus sp. TF02A-26]